VRRSKPAVVHNHFSCADDAKVEQEAGQLLFAVRHARYDRVIVCTGPELIQMYVKIGRAVQISSSNGVVLSEDVQGATTFHVVDCLAPDTVSETQRPNCVSLMYADSSDKYVHHAWFFLRVDPYENSTIFELDSSFILHLDTFYTGYYALESVNFGNYYVGSVSEGRFKIQPREDTADYNDIASFNIYRTYLCSSSSCSYIKSFDFVEAEIFLFL